MTKLLAKLKDACGVLQRDSIIGASLTGKNLEIVINSIQTGDFRSIMVISSFIEVSSVVSDIYVSFGYIYFRAVHGYTATSDDSDTTDKLLSWKGIASMYEGDIKDILLSREDYGHIFRVKVCSTKMIGISETINSSETLRLDQQVKCVSESKIQLINFLFAGLRSLSQ